MRYAIIAFILSGCGAVQCDTVGIDIYNHPTKRPPAGRVVLTCNGKTLVEAEAANVQTGGK